MRGAVGLGGVKEFESPLNGRPPVGGGVAGVRLHALEIDPYDGRDWSSFSLTLRGIAIAGSVIDTAVIFLFSYFSLAQIVHTHLLSDHDSSHLSRCKYHVSLERLAESNSSFYCNDSNF
jgi:hypothetical protein